MKIQEMRSGISHLNKRVEVETRDNVFEMRPISEPLAESAPEPVTVNELDEPRWSVISRDQREAGGLTYRQASELIAELDAHKISGLCIITDDAASRMNS